MLPRPLVAALINSRLRFLENRGCRAVECRHCQGPPSVPGFAVRFLAFAGCVLSLAYWLPATLAAEDLEKAFRAARPGILQQLRDRKPETRIAAARKLREFPVVEAANVILLQGCTSPYADVQRESFQALCAIGTQPEVLKHLQGELTRDAKRGGLEFRSAAIACALLSSSDVAVQDSVKPWLEQAARAPRGPAVIVSMVDELGPVGDEAALRALVKLGEQPLFQKFGPRRAWIQALTQVRVADAVTLLVQKLPALQGETRSDVLRYLTSLNGARLDSDDQWAAWWQKEKPNFKFPEASNSPAALKARQGEPTYYGLPLYGTKIVFILDTSSSMAGQRIVAAQRELVSAIAALPDGIEFNVLAFNTNVTVWQSQLVPTSPLTKEGAARFVMAQTVRDQTASFDALEAAFVFDAEAIYFLTDGEPTTGKIKQPDRIVAALSEPNRVRRITVNCLGIGVGRPGGVFDQFLNSLAGQNFGLYRHVDQ